MQLEARPRGRCLRVINIKGIFKPESRHLACSHVIADVKVLLKLPGTIQYP